MLKARKADLHYDSPHDNKNRGRRWRKSWPDRAIRSAISAISALPRHEGENAGRLEPYSPPNWDHLPAWIEGSGRLLDHDPSGTLGLFVNKDALGGKPCRPAGRTVEADYKGMAAISIQSSRGGLFRRCVDQSCARRVSFEFRPGDYLLSRSCARTIRSFPSDLVARVVSGEIADPSGL